MSEPFHLVDADGWALAVSEFPAHGETRGVVIAGHAMMCNRRSLDRPRGQGLASTLARAGLHVYSFDARGHGASGPAPAAGGSWRYDDLIDHDLPAMARWVRRRHPDHRIGLIGHSLIGHAGLLWLGSDRAAPIDALVIYAGNLWLPQFEPNRLRWLRKWATLCAWELMSRPLGYLPARRLRLGSDDTPLALVQDFRHWARQDRCVRRRDGFDYLAGRARVKQPVLAFVGERDSLLCVPECNQRFLDPVPDHELRLVPQADHMSLVIDPQSQPVWEHSASWLIAKLDR